MKQEFDYQWRELSDKNLEYNSNRIRELLNYTNQKEVFFNNKYCLDAGCGSGRWTWAMLKMGSKVDSFDISHEAIEICKKINPNAFVFDLMDLQPTKKYDFVLCWGVLHHVKQPYEGFVKVSSQVKSGGLLHIMVYHKDTQKIYESGRKTWRLLNEKQKTALCQTYSIKYGGSIHGWWDAFNPEYNYSYNHNEIKKWFLINNYKNIKLTKKYNINMIGTSI